LVGLKLERANTLTRLLELTLEGGTVYQGKGSYPSMEAALQDLDAGIKAYMEENRIWTT